MGTDQYGIFRHSFSSRTTLIISPSTLLLALVLSSLGVRSINTKPPRLIHMVFRKRSASSTRTGLVFGRVQVYKLLPSALVTRAMTWSAVSSSGGVADSSAAATMLRLGFPIFWTNSGGMAGDGGWWFVCCKGDKTDPTNFFMEGLNCEQGCCSIIISHATTSLCRFYTVHTHFDNENKSQSS